MFFLNIFKYVVFRKWSNQRVDWSTLTCAAYVDGEGRRSVFIHLSIYARISLTQPPTHTNNHTTTQMSLFYTTRQVLVGAPGGVAPIPDSVGM